jgi:hypothetical protein
MARGPWQTLSLRARASAERLGRALGWLRRAASLRRTVRGRRYAASSLPAALDLGDRCAACGSPAVAQLPPSRSPRLAFASLPAALVPACEACARRARSRLVREAALAVASPAAGGFGALALAWAWEWAPFGALVVAAATGALLPVAVLAASRIVRELRSATRLAPAWRGLPAHWSVATDGAARFEVCGASLAARLRERLGLQGVEALLVERDALLARWLVAPAVVLLPPLVWWYAHPLVRVVNPGPAPIEIQVDGRPWGLVPAIPGEAPNAGRGIRLPWGWRKLEARSAQGEIVDRVEGHVVPGLSLMWVPSRGARCFWVERVGYGRASVSPAASTPLGERDSFFSLDEPIDAWFQPSPAVSGPGTWLSGGVRRAVRYGPCPDAGP